LTGWFFDPVRWEPDSGKRCFEAMHDGVLAIEKRAIDVKYDQVHKDPCPLGPAIGRMCRVFQPGSSGLGHILARICSQMARCRIEHFFPPLQKLPGSSTEPPLPGEQFWISRKTDGHFAEHLSQGGLSFECATPRPKRQKIAVWLKVYINASGKLDGRVSVNIAA
jgi:hypothetical protein